MQRIKFFDHLILMLGAAVLVLPVLVAFMSSTHAAAEIHARGLFLTPGAEGVATYTKVLTQKGGFTGEVTGARMAMNSLILGLGFALGKIALSMMAAYGLVYFRFRFATPIFWMIFTTLLLPLEVRIMPSYQVMSTLGALNSYWGLIVPLLASATGTFYFRQFFKSVPDELLEAARIDGAGPWRFFLGVLVPLSRPMMAAIFIIMFVYGWNQYLWPMLMTTDERFFTLLRGIKSILQVWIGAQIPDYNEAFALAVLAMLPPLGVVLAFQRLFIKGLTESDK
ncbi:glycerol-3-phosphate ABC transporter permease [Rhodobacter xanthinilyticus]|uniref:sn-glycerol-3-phosphate transport system permease protein UgpE n=1 Tax=Rhodobacter xanthinilyticus TaxID=1850250 RepID=A0A1D9MDX3_9RHOB|nr:ABC transporter permease subunit [Rhodobacter xanthinilyticus]AOZ69978.1 glycerol-3-phosphate ABC transporter permease [Rhodobacter xanthinilyticus]